MTAARLLIFLAITACDPSSIEPDADAFDSSIQDAGWDEDSGADSVDASVSGRDASFDSGIDSGRDAGTDASFDSGIDSGRDAGTDASFDSGIDSGRDAGCVPDVAEPDDSAAAAWFAGARSVPFSEELRGTWHSSDSSDWIRLDISTSGMTRYEVRTPPGTLARLEVECPSGLYSCSGIGASRIGNRCEVAPRIEVVQLDVACGPEGSVVRAGADRGISSACARWISVSSP